MVTAFCLQFAAIYANAHPSLALACSKITKQLPVAKSPSKITKQLPVAKAIACSKITKSWLLL
jgi:hypothetical protein